MRVGHSVTSTRGLPSSPTAERQTGRFRGWPAQLNSRASPRFRCSAQGSRRSWSRASRSPSRGPNYRKTVFSAAPWSSPVSSLGSCPRVSGSIPDPATLKLIKNIMKLGTVYYLFAICYSFMVWGFWWGLFNIFLPISPIIDFIKFIILSFLSTLFA